MSSTLESQSARTHAEVPPPFSAGDVISEKYEITGVRGVGGTAFILAARHIELDRPVAIKVPRAAGTSAERIRHEAAALAHLHSAHVPRLFDVDRLPDGSPYLVMELLAGLDLRELLARGGSLPTDEAVGYVLQIANALSTVHAQGIVHLDIKPENIHVGLVDDAPHVTLLDFGTSKWIGQEELSAHDDRRVRGTPLYMAPERFRNETVDARADIWSLGCVLYELLAERSPFKRTRTEQGIAAALHDEPASLRTFRSGFIEPELEAIVLRCLRKDIDARYRSVAELSCALAPHGPDDAYRLAARCCDVLGLAGAPALEELHSRELSRQPTVAWQLDEDRGHEVSDTPYVHVRSNPDSVTDDEADSHTIVGHPPADVSEARPRRASGIHRKESAAPEVARDALVAPSVQSAEIEAGARAQTRDVQPRTGVQRRALSRAQIIASVTLIVGLFSILHVMFSATPQPPSGAARPAVHLKHRPAKSPSPSAPENTLGSQVTRSDDAVPTTNSMNSMSLRDSPPTQARQLPPELIDKVPTVERRAPRSITKHRKPGDARTALGPDTEHARGQRRTSPDDIDVGY
jgi:serine/threonine protein kinase